MNWIKFFFGLLIVFSLGACGWRSIPIATNNVEAAWAEVDNQYKRRADLIPNLVNTVKGYATHEKEALQAVIEARAKATQTSVHVNDLNPTTLKQFEAAQSWLTNALSRLLLVVEQYPNLKANENFLSFQTQLEGTENRIAIARRRYIESVNQFNIYVTVPPQSWTNSLLYKYEKSPQFEVSEAVKETPKVEF